ncbi:trypsin-like peptidase domain-containing protein [Streptomyces diastatochromogenes]|uniref:S1 family peptidase n=1 Tax=Streptomyces diastatochromogenes TaxID=42236 RepID=UPI002F25EC1E
MHRPLVGTLATAVMGAAALLATAGPAGAAPAGAPAHHKPKPPRTKAVDFAGTVALDNCSGSIVKMPASQPNDPALVMTNGHCLESGMPSAGEVIVDQPSSRSFTVLDKSAGDLGTIKATKVAYSTMTDTDVTLYQTGSTYAQIEQKYGIKALELSADHPTKGAGITVVSGYWKKTYSCSVDGFAPTVKEGDWTWKDSVRYTPECKVIGGTSGSPVVGNSTGKVTAINNTINENGERCTLNNPCEVDENGNVTVHDGIGYAQETYFITKCFGAGNKLDLNASGCTLPKPSGVRH